MARAPSLGGLPKSGFAAHAPPSTSPLLRKPSVYRTAVDPQGSRDNLGAFASLHATHRADTHRFQRRVIQFASIVLSHPLIRITRDSACQWTSAITYGPINRPLAARQQ